MNKSFSFTRPETNQLEQRVETLRASLQSTNPELFPERTGAVLVSRSAEQAVFQLPLWGREVLLEWPLCTAQDLQKGAPLSTGSLALLLYYFATADGAPLTGSWTSFANLPDGRFYNQAFQGYSGQLLTRAFGQDLQALAQAAQKAGGEAYSEGDASFLFWALPRLPLLVVYWQGDEDFPPSAQILFDAAVPHYLPTDVCAIQGGGLARRIINLKSGA